VNNFSDNKLFELFSLEDLADLFDINLIVFNNSEQNETKTCTIYKPNDSDTQINDYVHLSFNKNNKIKYKWLMPNKISCLIRKTLLNPMKSDDYFLKVNTNYSNRFLLIDSQCLFQCFGETLLNSCLNVYLFSHFLSECSVHLLISLKDLNFDDFLLNNSQDPNEMINYLVIIYCLIALLFFNNLNSFFKNRINYGVKIILVSKIFSKSLILKKKMNIR